MELVQTTAEPNPVPTAVDSPAVTVVVGAGEGSSMAERLAACLAALQPQAEAIGAEIIVVEAGPLSGGEGLRARYPQVRWLSSPRGTLVPRLWKQGIEAAHAPIVALTIAQCIPAADWLRQIVVAMDGGPAAAGGPAGARFGPAAVGGALVGPQDGSAVEWALYFARYSNWMPGGTLRLVHDMAADNAAYRRSALDRCGAAMQDGFWEVLVHEQLAARGQVILWEPAMQVQFHAAGSLAEMARTRCEHGRTYAATRSGNRGLKRVLRAVTAPALPFLLLLRIYRRVRSRQPQWLRHFWRSLPALAVLVTAWSLGELRGYVQPQP